MGPGSEVHIVSQIPPASQGENLMNTSALLTQEAVLTAQEACFRPTEMSRFIIY